VAGGKEVAGNQFRELPDRETFGAIGDFLAAHRLHPSPDNYALVYQVVTDPSSQAAAAILALTGDGVRLSQSDADRIKMECGLEAATPAPPSAAEAIADARRQVEGFTSIVEATQVETQAYGADLARGAAELDRAGSGLPAAALTARITGEMIQRTRDTEAQLEAARHEAQELRAKLAEAEEEARSDPLTQLPNRRAFEDRLAELTAAGGTASLAICDVDLFKRINDSHGHAVGDRVLRMVAQVLRDHCTEHMVARIGGDEFVVLFGNLDAQGAACALDQARADLAAREFKVRGTDAALGKVTFSAGVASCADRAGDPPLKRADALLYQAKNSGRNQVAVEPL
jgi:diguanylate cyclase